jgi:hypothetical protein
MTWEFDCKFTMNLSKESSVCAVTSRPVDAKSDNNIVLDYLRNILDLPRGFDGIPLQVVV